MNIAAQYAKALRALMTEHPERGSEYVAHLRRALARRGHEALLPAVVREYEKLELMRERTGAAAAATPERERTRILFELYKKLTNPSA
jgi:hypothetical protein